MKIGICPWAFDQAVVGRRPLAEITARAGAAGFDAVEASYAAHSRISAPCEWAVPVTSIATLALHRFPLTSPNAAHRAAASEAVRGMIAMARVLGARSISFSPGPVRAPNEATLEACIAALRTLTDEAAASGIVLAVENLPGHLLATRQTMLRLLAAVEGLGLCLDLGNALADPPVERWLDTFGDRLVKLHLSDGRIAAEALRPTLIGEGDVPWPALRGRLLDLSTAVDIYLETPPRLGIQSEPEAAALAAARLRVAEVLECA
jgi:sugar phosphate isomerase/epimerase